MVSRAECGPGSLHCAARTSSVTHAGGEAPANGSPYPSGVRYGVCGSQRCTCRYQSSARPWRASQSSASGTTWSARSMPSSPGFRTSVNPRYHCQALWRSAKLDTVAVRIPVHRSLVTHDRRSQPVRKPRSTPSGRRSAVLPPWDTTPERVPKVPVISAVRLGRHGTSEA